MLILRTKLSLVPNRMSRFRRSPITRLRRLGFHTCFIDIYKKLLDQMFAWGAKPESNLMDAVGVSRVSRGAGCFALSGL